MAWFACCWTDAFVVFAMSSNSLIESFLILVISALPSATAFSTSSTSVLMSPISSSISFVRCLISSRSWSNILMYSTLVNDETLLIKASATWKVNSPNTAV